MAGNKIYGITIDIEGKNDGLVKSLKEVDKSLGSTKSALNDVNKALKLDPKNTELLTQKQALLKKEISTTGDKLKLMKQVAEEAAKGLETGAVTQEQYAKLTAEISKTEQSLKAMTTEAERNDKALEECGSEASKLKEQMDALDKNIDKTDRALKSVNAALKLDPGNTELIAQKQELLTKQVSQTKEKLDLMKKSAVEAAEGLEKGTVTKEEYAKLTAEIATTEKQLGELETAASTVDDSLKDAGDAAKDAGEDIEDAGKDTKDTKTAFGDLDKVTGGLASTIKNFATNPLALAAAAIAAVVTAAKKMIDEFKKMANTIKEIATAAVKGFVEALQAVSKQIEDTLVALGKLTRQGASYADEILTLSATTGLTAEKIQELKYAAELTDVSVETMAGSLTKLEKNMASAEKGSGAAADTFKKLGVQIKKDDGTFRNQYDVMMDTVKALSKVEDEVERDTLAMNVFGKSAKELNPLLKKSTEELDAITKAAHDSGYVLSDEVLEQYGEFDDTVVMLEKGLESLEHGFGIILLPFLNQIATDGVSLLNEFAKGVVDANGDMEKIGQTITTVFPKAMEKLVKNIPQGVAIIKQLITTFLKTINDNLPVFLDAGMDILDALVDGLLNQESINNIMDGISMIVLRFTDFLKEHGKELVDLGVYVITSLINGLSDTLPELIPAVADAIMTIVDALTSDQNLDKIIDAALSLFEAMTDGLEKALPIITEKLPGAVKRICDKLIESDMISKIIDAGITLFQAILDSGVIDEVIRVLSENAGPITQLLVKIGTEIVKLKAAMADIVLDAMKDIGNQMAFELAAGMLEKIPFIGEKLSVFFRSIAAMLPGGSAYIGPTNVPSYPVLDNNAQPSGRSATAVPLSQGAEQYNQTTKTQAQQNLLNNAFRNSNATDSSGTPTIVVNSYIGSTKMGTAVAKAQNENSYVSGGR